MSPEQALGERLDARTDLFSLGAVLYEMATGKQAFSGTTISSLVENVLHGQPVPATKLNPGIPSDLAGVIAKALEKPREARYPSASELLEDLRKCHERVKAAAKGALLNTLLVRLRNPWISGTLALCLITLVLASYLIVDRRARIDWARRTALPEIERLVGETRLQDVSAAYDLAVRAERYIAGDPRLAELLSQCSMTVAVSTDPPGARVAVKEYSSTQAEWRELGSTPLDDIRLPKGILRWRLEKDGYDTVYAAAPTFSWGPEGFKPLSFSRKLDPRGTIPPGMTRVQGGDSAAGRLPDFLMDIHEVTNREYQAFVDDGGYARRDYWKHPFVEHGRVLSFEQAMATFVDKSGMPGPATWQAGGYPAGKDDEPVSGVSWFEAAAYAEFEGKALPTIHHWELAALPSDWLRNQYLPSSVIPQSNFGQSLVPVGSTEAMNSFGSDDLLGNVREWCFNRYGEDRSIRGSAWNDASYHFSLVVAASPFDRDARNGFRCVRYPEAEVIPAAVFGPFGGYPAPTDYYAQKPVPDEVFQVFLDRYSYDPRNLDTRQERRDETPRDWILDKVSVATAYEGERLPIFLYLPRNARPPFQAVVFYPGSDVFIAKQEELNSFELDKMDFIVKSGRVVVLPVYKGSLERSDEYSRWSRAVAPEEELASRRWAEALVPIVQDFKRTLDYLATRDDIDASRIGYYGISEGGILAPILLAVEGKRIKAGVSALGSLYPVRAQPQADASNYVTRVRTPTLMLNGIYDTHLTLKECVEPMYRLLGTPDTDKKLVVYETDHFIPKSELTNETLAWYDKYLGPVRAVAE